MNKSKNLIGIVLLIIGIIISTSGCIYANEVVKINNNKRFELPSKIHKDGEGFYEVGKMLVPRYRHSATLLKDGRIFIAGGNINKKGRQKTNEKSYITGTTEIYDPETNTSVQGPDLITPRIEHITQTLDNGKVLIIGGKKIGYDNAMTIELYDPITNSIKEVYDLSKPLNNKGYRIGSYVVMPPLFLLPISKDFFLISIDKQCAVFYNANNNSTKVHHLDEVLPVFHRLGQRDWIIDNNIYSITRLKYIIAYNPKNFKIYSKIQMGQYYNHFILLNTNKFLCIGGKGNKKGSAGMTAQICDPVLKSCRFIKSLLYEPVNQITELVNLENGNILILRGYPYISPTVEIFDPYSEKFIKRNYHMPNIYGTITKLPKGNILYSGGLVNNYYLLKIDEPSDKVYIYKYKK